MTKMSWWQFEKKIGYFDSYRNRNGEFSFRTLDRELADKIMPEWRDHYKSDTPKMKGNR